MSRSARSALVLLAILFPLSRASTAQPAYGHFWGFGGDTLRRAGILEVRCTRAGTAFDPPHFAVMKIWRGSAPDSFTAAPTYWRPFSFEEFTSGGTYLMGLWQPAPAARYEVITRFRPIEPPQRTFDAIDPLDHISVADRDSLVSVVVRDWDLRGALTSRRPETPWSMARRDTLVSQLCRAVETGKPPSWKQLPNGEIAVSISRGPDDTVGVPEEWMRLASPLHDHPDSVTRSLAISLWDTTRVGSIRTLALSLLWPDTSTEARHWISLRRATGTHQHDYMLSSMIRTDTTGGMRALAWSLLLPSVPGDWIERNCFIALRKDTGSELRALRWDRIARGETQPYRPMYGWIDNAPRTWDNWELALAWTSAEARRAFDDPLPRLRIVGTRVLCVRHDDTYVARAVRRLRTRSDPRFGRLGRDELCSIAEVLPTSRNQEALETASRLALHHDPVGYAAFDGILYVDTVVTRHALAQRALHPRQPYDDRATVAARALQLRAHRSDLPTFHKLALHASEQTAYEAFHGIGLIEGPREMAAWVEKRWKGPPPLREWGRYVDIESELRSERARRSIPP